MKTPCQVGCAICAAAGSQGEPVATLHTPSQEILSAAATNTVTVEVTPWLPFLQCPVIPCLGAAVADEASSVGCFAIYRNGPYLAVEVESINSEWSEWSKSMSMVSTAGVRGSATLMRLHRLLAQHMPFNCGCVLQTCVQSHTQAPI